MMYQKIEMSFEPSRITHSEGDIMSSTKVRVYSGLIYEGGKLLNQTKKGTIVIKACNFFLRNFYTEYSPLKILNDNKADESKCYAFAINNLKRNKKISKLDLSQTEKVSVNFPHQTAQALKKVCQSNLSNAVNLCLMFLIVINNQSRSGEMNKLLISLNGNKNRLIMKDSVKALLHNNHYERIYDVFGGSLALSTTAADHADKIIINSYDEISKLIEDEKSNDLPEIPPEKGIYNFFRVVRNKPVELICKILLFEVDEATFESIKKEYDKSNLSSVDYAAYYFYLMNTCIRGKMKSFYERAKETTLLNKACLINEYSCFLNHKKVSFVSKNFKKLVGQRRLCSKSGSLMLFDPPYLVGRDYNTDFKYCYHSWLINTALYGDADFVYFARITITRSETRKEVFKDGEKINQTFISNSPEQLRRGDKQLRKKLKSLFAVKGWKKNLYYILIPYKKCKFYQDVKAHRQLGVTYEIIITSIKPDDAVMSSVKKEYIKTWDEEGYWKGYKRRIRWGQLTER